jgi:uncharacterized protein (TIGR03382 family)
MEAREKLARRIVELGLAAAPGEATTGEATTGDPTAGDPTAGEVPPGTVPGSGCGSGGAAGILALLGLGAGVSLRRRR